MISALAIMILILAQGIYSVRVSVIPLLLFIVTFEVMRKHEVVDTFPHDHLKQVKRVDELLMLFYLPKA